MKIRNILLSVILCSAFFAASACGGRGGKTGETAAGGLAGAAVETAAGGLAGAVAETAAGGLAGAAAETDPSAGTNASEGYSDTDAEIYLSLGTSQGQFGTSYSTFASRLQQESGGRIFLNVYAGGQMGGDDILMDAVNHRTLSMVQSSTIVQISQVPELALLDIPYVFDSLNQCNTLLNDTLKDFFQPWYNAGGLQLLCWYTNDYRVITTGRPVRTVEDLAGLRIRTVGNPYHAVFWSALGAEPVSVPFSDTVYAAQTGQIDAQENASKASAFMGIHKLQPWLLRTRHLPFINTVVMNLEVYESLSEADRKFLSDFFSRNAALLGATGYDSDSYGYFHVIDPKDDTLAALKNAANAVESAVRADLGDDILDSYLEIVFR